MTGRHHVPPHLRQRIEQQREQLIAGVPENMQEGLRKMVAMAQARGLSREDAFNSVREALRANQTGLSPMKKAWLVVEAGCMWLEKEQGS